MKYLRQGFRFFVSFVVATLAAYGYLALATQIKRGIFPPSSWVFFATFGVSFFVAWFWIIRPRSQART
jgi:hypothetical protein